MHDAVADHVVVLAMIQNCQIKHAGIFNGAAHELVILNTMTVIGYGHDTGFTIDPIGAISWPAKSRVMAPVG
jgi:hypothetical protein